MARRKDGMELPVQTNNILMVQIAENYKGAYPSCKSWLFTHFIKANGTEVVDGT